MGSRVGESWDFRSLLCPSGQLNTCYEHTLFLQLEIHACLEPADGGLQRPEEQSGREVMAVLEYKLGHGDNTRLGSGQAFFTHSRVTRP